MEFLGLTQTHHLWLFFVLLFGIIVLPGMDMAYTLASSLVGGLKAGFTAVAGQVLGGMLHVLMGVLGVGLLLKTFPEAFNAVLIFGALYIAWIGWSLLKGAPMLAEVSDAPPQRLSGIFFRAFMTCMLNPKAYLFMLAVFPQFLRIEYGPIAVQAVFMGLIIALTQTAVYGTVVIGASSIRGWLHNNQTGQQWLGQGIGVMLIGTAAWTGWQGWLI